MPMQSVIIGSADQCEKWMIDSWNLGKSHQTGSTFAVSVWEHVDMGQPVVVEWYNTGLATEKYSLIS